MDRCSLYRNNHGKDPAATPSLRGSRQEDVFKGLASLGVCCAAAAQAQPQKCSLFRNTEEREKAAAAAGPTLLEAQGLAGAPGCGCRLSHTDGYIDSPTRQTLLLRQIRCTFFTCEADDLQSAA